MEINGGEITITMGSGDSDAIDSNGDIIINGGKISITGQSGFDYDGKPNSTAARFTLTVSRLPK